MDGFSFFLLSFFLGAAAGMITAIIACWISNIDEIKEIITNIVELGEMTKDADTLVIFSANNEKVYFFLDKHHTEIHYKRYNGNCQIINPKSRFGKKLMNICFTRVLKDKFPELRF